MKRLIGAWLCCMLCLACVLPFVSCRAPAQVQQNAPRSIRIGVAVYDQYDTFIGELMGFFMDAVRNKEKQQRVTITIMRETADGKQVAQNNQVEGFIEAGCDVICVNLVDRTDAAVIIDKAEAAGIPIIFFNRELVEEDLARSDLLYYVGAKALESGLLQGQLVADLCKNNMDTVDKNGDGVLQYVMLEGEAGHQDAIVRTEYSVTAISAAGYQVERLEDEIANWIRSQAETRMTQWLATHGTDIELVLANNDDMALGAIDALKNAQLPREDWPVVIGIDGTSVGLEAVAAGEMAGTVKNDAKGQAQQMLELAYALATNSSLPPLEEGKYIRLPYSMVTPENISEYL